MVAPISRREIATGARGTTEAILPFRASCASAAALER
jgi:hypothetical protein